MDKLTLENIESYFNLYDQLSLKDPYIIEIDHAKFLKDNHEKLEAGDTDIFIYKSDEKDIGFLEINREGDILFIENIFLINEFCSIENFRTMLSFAENQGRNMKAGEIKFIGLNDEGTLIQALASRGFTMIKEHVQMEKTITGDNYCSINDYKTFCEINNAGFIFDIMKDCMKGSIFNYTLEEIKEILDDEEYFGCIFYKNENIAGFGITYTNNDRNRQEKELIIYIEQVAVLEKYRRMGFGGQIIEFLNKHGRSLGMEKSRLHVYKDNINAFNLYKKLGYNEVKSIGQWQRILPCAMLDK